MSQATKDFFRNLILGTMEERELKNITRHDMIHLLMKAKKGNSTEVANYLGIFVILLLFSVTSLSLARMVMCVMTVEMSYVTH